MSGGPPPKRLPSLHRNGFVSDTSWANVGNATMPAKDVLPSIPPSQSKASRIRQVVAAHVRYVIVGSLVTAVGVTILGVGVFYAGEPDGKDTFDPADPRRETAAYFVNNPDFTATVRLRSPPWSSDLGNTNSSEFRKHASHLEQLIDLMFEDSELNNDFKFSVVTGFSSPDNKTTEVTVQLFLKDNHSVTEEQMDKALGQGCSALLQTKINREVTKIDCTSTVISDFQDDQCGRERLYPRRQTSRIFGGDATDWYGVYPWVVMILKNGSYLCGGTVWDKEHILTSASCVHDLPLVEKYQYYDLVNTSSLEIIAGKWKFDIKDTWRYAQRVDVASAMVHKKFDAATQNNDIAILRLNRALKLNRVVERICHPTENITMPDNYTGTVAGWGLVNKTHLVYPVQLMETEVHLYSQAECQGVIADPIHNDTICGNTVGGTCQGDAGGPLFVHASQETETWTMLGIIVGRSECTSRGLYTYVPRYLQWINNLTSVTR